MRIVPFQSAILPLPTGSPSLLQIYREMEFKSTTADSLNFGTFDEVRLLQLRSKDREYLPFKVVANYFRSPNVLGRCQCNGTP